MVDSMFGFWRKLGLKRRFLAFFLLVSVLPLLCFSFIFIHKTRDLLMERNQELLQTGLLLSQEIIFDELDRLGLTVNQLASLTIDEEYDQAIRRHDFKPLSRILDRYMKSRNADLLVLESPQGEPVAIAETTPQHSPAQVLDQFRKPIQAAQQGNVVTSIEEIRFLSEPQPRLMMVAAAPVYSPENSGKVSGILLLARDLSRLENHPDFVNLPPDLQLRIIARSPQSLSPIVTSPRSATGVLSLSDSQLLAAAGKGQPISGAIQGIEQKSAVRKIKNLSHEVVGYILISVPQQNINELINQNTLYILLFLLIGITLVSLLGAWFNRTFITPLNHLSAVTEEVTAGNLNARVETGIPYEDLDRTLRNFNTMLAQLEEKENLRVTFVSTLTHDLRTPLIAQRHVVEFLEGSAKGGLDETSANLLTGLARSNKHLLGMVSKLLDTYQYEDGHILLNEEAINLRSLVEECFSELQAIALEKKISLVNDIDSRLEIWVDPGQFMRILINLVGNSLENIEEHDEIRIHALQNKQTVEVRVSDNGPGIEPDLLPHLFERYPSMYGRRQKIGSGLGLYICKMIVELHGGKIWVESHPSQGTRFYIQIPAHNQENHDERTASERTNPDTDCRRL
jgi:signal transduction histidine kinase